MPFEQVVPPPPINFAYELIFPDFGNNDIAPVVPNARPIVSGRLVLNVDFRTSQVIGAGGGTNAVQFAGQPAHYLQSGDGGGGTGSGNVFAARRIGMPLIAPALLDERIRAVRMVVTMAAGNPLAQAGDPTRPNFATGFWMGLDRVVGFQGKPGFGIIGQGTTSWFFAVRSAALGLELVDLNVTATAWNIFDFEMVQATPTQNARLTLFVNGALRLTRTWGVGAVPLPVYADVPSSWGWCRFFAADNVGGPRRVVMVHRYYETGGPQNRDGVVIT